jgi:MraZ protein
VGRSGEQPGVLEVAPLVLSGEFYHAVDAKSRLTIPAKLRDAVDTEVQGRGFFGFVDFDGVLCLYTPTAYERLAPMLVETQLRASKEVRDYKRLRYGLAEHLEVDRLGRVLVPEKLLKRGGIEKDVAIVGCQDHLEIWDRERWEAFVKIRLPEHDALAVKAMEVAQARAAWSAAVAPAQEEPT